MLRILGDIRREVNWQLKRLLPFSPRIPARIERDLLALAETFESGQQERFQSLASTYELKTWPLGGEDKEIQWNLSVLDVLDQHVDPSSGPPGSLDVGSRHWGYLPALVSFRPGPWLGVEVDGNQRYLNGNTRAQVARAHAERVDGATYRVGCVTEVQETFGLITWFLPFVTEEPMLCSGLPRRLYQPEALLEHVWSLVAEGGALMVTNLEEEEAQVQEELFRRASIPSRSLGPLQSVWPAYDKERYGWFARKEKG